MEARKLILRADVQPEVWMQGDPAQLEQLLSLLMDNAVIYADEGGTVWVSLQKQEKRVCLSVRNTCGTLPDVPPEKLFDRFYRFDAARTQQTGGYGNAPGPVRFPQPDFLHRAVLRRFCQDAAAVRGVLVF